MTGVVGLDLSLQATGWAHWSPALGWATGTVHSKGSDRDKAHDVYVRLERLRTGILRNVYSNSPSLVVIERPAFSSNSGHAGDRAALFWLVWERLTDWQIPIAACPPEARMRYATGKGRAAKDEVLAAAIKRYDTAEIRNNDEGDAVVMAAMGARYAHDKGGLSQLAEASLPMTHIEAMTRVHWPPHWPAR